VLLLKNPFSSNRTPIPHFHVVSNILGGQFRPCLGSAQGADSRSHWGPGTAPAAKHPPAGGTWCRAVDAPGTECSGNKSGVPTK
jgi:hypothetical protein